MLATGDGAIPKAGNKGVAGSSGATKPSSQRKAPGNCLVLKPERARAEQSEQHGRRGAWRRGAERVLVPGAFLSQRLWRHSFNGVCTRDGDRALDFRIGHGLDDTAAIASVEIDSGLTPSLLRRVGERAPHPVVGKLIQPRFTPSQPQEC